MSIKNEVVNKIVKVLDSKKATDIKVLYVGEVTTLTDYFVLATANSVPQAQALYDHIEEELQKDGIKPQIREGYNTAEWILVGFDDIVVHIFLKDAREFYGLEHIWKDAIDQDISDLLID